MGLGSLYRGLINFIRIALIPTKRSNTLNNKFDSLKDVQKIRPLTDEILIDDPSVTRGALPPSVLHFMDEFRYVYIRT